MDVTAPGVRLMRLAEAAETIAVQARADVEVLRSAGSELSIGQVFELREHARRGADELYTILDGLGRTSAAQRARPAHDSLVALRKELDGIATSLMDGTPDAAAVMRATDRYSQIGTDLAIAAERGRMPRYSANPELDDLALIQRPQRNATMMAGADEHAEGLQFADEAEDRFGLADELRKHARADDPAATTLDGAASLHEIDELSLPLTEETLAIRDSLQNRIVGSVLVGRERVPVALDLPRSLGVRMASGSDDIDPDVLHASRRLMLDRGEHYAQSSGNPFYVFTNGDEGVSWGGLVVPQTSSERTWRKAVEAIGDNGVLFDSLPAGWATASNKPAAVPAHSSRGGWLRRLRGN